jgi:hypothetical protein
MKLVFDKLDENNKTNYIEVINCDIPIKITIHDFIQLMEENHRSSNNFETTSASTSTSSYQTSSDYSITDILNDNEQDEPNDELMNIDDSLLISQVKRLLKISHSYNITDYYRKNNIKYRAFTLSSLYSEKNGINSDSQRKKIRDMARRCQQFLSSDYVKQKDEDKKKEKQKLRQKLDDMEKKLTEQINRDSD